MKLLVDMGNSRMKWATISNGVLSRVSVENYGDFSKTSGQAWQGMGLPEKVIVSCVSTNEHWAMLQQVVQRLWGIPVERIASPAKAHGVKNSYQDAAKLGSDRWAALVAARHLYPGLACVVDCGTAMTVDGLSANGVHLGGVIVPGIQMMQSSLALNTAAISFEPGQQQDTLPASLLVTDTSTAIIQGSWLASAAVVEKIVTGLCEEENDKVTCIITGGNGPQLATRLSMNVVIDAELVLKGLAIIAGEEITL